MDAKAGSAAAAGSSAGKKKQAILDISPQVEQSIIKAIAGVPSTDFFQTPAATATAAPAPTKNKASLPRSSSSAAATANSTIAAALTHQICEIYKGLTSQGFTPHQVERALHALPLHSIAIGSALDWLLLHLDRTDLPRQYADQVQAFGEVELRHRASNLTLADSNHHQTGDDDDDDDDGDDGDDASLAAAAAAAEKAKELEREAAAAAAAEADKERIRKEQEEKEKETRRAWILQYAEDSSSDSDADSAGGDGGGRNGSDDDDRRSGTGSVIEDWEVWGDPREVDRRRAERARGALPRQDRLQLIATELAKTLAGAAQAKSTGDKAEQRTYGQMIGQLKREMVELGVTEADLPSAEGVAAEAVKGEPAAAAAKTAENNSNSSSDDDDDDDGLGFDLFDGGEGDGGGGGGGIDELETLPGGEKRSKRRAKAMAAAALQPWGGGKTSTSSNKKKGGKPDPTMKTPTQFQQPKALLQQLCQQKYNFSAPRYERLPPGGSRDPGEGGGDCRYSVTIDPGSSASFSKKKGGKERKKLTVKRTMVVPEEDDGWAKIEDAQNAAATLALLAVGGDDDPELWRLIPPPFNELWLTWREDGLGHEEEESDEAAAVRETFVRDLIAAKQKQEEMNDLESEEQEEDVKEYVPWAESLRRRLSHRQGDPKLLKSEAFASDRMLMLLKQWRSSEEGAKWMSFRGNLPAAALRDQLKECLASDDVVVVSGETGSGKTTQIPQFILESETEAGRGGACSVVCTQPRRIAAISVAERVASERGEAAPGERGAAVGYAVRLDSATTAETRLLFCTTGILLRRLASDPALATVTHVIVDEVHERTLQGDFLIALLKDLVKHRREAGLPLKVVLMSATLDSILLTDYFNSCPTLHAAGRTFPVEQLFLEDAMAVTEYVLAPDAPAALRPGGARRDRQRRLENAVGSRNKAAVRSGWGDDEGDEILNPHYDEEMYLEYGVGVRRNLARVNEEKIDFDLLEDLVGFIHENQPSGAILVFLPGMAEISNLERRLAASRRFSKCWLVALHSTVAPVEQRKAFRVPPEGTRKIVIATNIAETSLTIEDVVYVVDSGKLKERRHDAARSMSLLVEDWVSVASAKQRRGRAGRVREGVCYAMYTKDRFENRMKKYQTPEMARVPLEELILQVHLLRVASSAAIFAARVLQPPPEKAVTGALRVLRDVGALTDDETLTPLGHYLAQLPVDARVGKLLLLATSLGCLSPALTIATCLSHKAPFSSGLGAAEGSDRARAALASPDSGTLAAGQQSDHLVMAAAVDGWRAARRGGGRKAATEFARKFCLSEQTLDMLEDMRGQFAAMLADIGFLTSGNSDGKNNNRNSGRGGGGRGSATTSSSSMSNWFDDPSLRCNKYAQYPAVLKAVLFAALYPNIAVMDDGSGSTGGSSSRSSSTAARKPCWHDGTGPVAIHPGSLCSTLESGKFHRPFLTYLEKVRTSQVYLRDCTVVSPAAVLLFGGKTVEVEHSVGRVTLDGWLRVRTAGRTAALVGKLRGALEALLRRKVAAPRKEVGDDGAGGAAVIGAIVELLNYEEAAQNWDK